MVGGAVPDEQEALADEEDVAESEVSPGPGIPFHPQ
jgi:hypothetical protein